jgi:hypothetical protein
MFSPDDLLFLAPEQPLSGKLTGGFARRILVILDSDGQSPGALDFLQRILTAAGINLEKDTLLAVTSGKDPVSFLSVMRQKQPEQILVFGPTPAQAGIFIEVALYQPVVFYQSTWLFADSLPALEPDKNRKGLLWRALQQMFIK